MRRLVLIAACLASVFVHAQNTAFTDFYEGYVCEGRQAIADVGLTWPCSFWVSTSGSDDNPGTKQAPFLTLQHARDAVRDLPSSAFHERDVYVYIEAGIYRLEQPLVLDYRDSGRKGRNVIYSAAPGANPVISGAIQVTGWSYNSTLGLYTASITPCRSRQLYVNGNRAQRAQTIPTPSVGYPAGFLPHWTNVGPTNGGIEYQTTNPPLNPTAWEYPTTWTNPSEIEAVILTQWKMMRVPISSITGTTASGLITLQQPAWNNANVYFDSTTDAPGEWAFWQVTRFENALEFLTEPGQWYLDSTLGIVYYSPLPGEDMATADVELPLLETLIVGQGTLAQPIHNIRFEGLTFSYATWLGPSGPDGYVSDQSGQLLVGMYHAPNYIGHDQNLVPTPGNLSFTFASNIVFYGNIFEHLGAVGLQFGPGCNSNTINSNLFTDISSSAIEMGAVTLIDAHPNNPAYILNNNLITNNLITTVASEYVDAAAIFVGFTQYTTISQNTIVDVPWSGVAIGWGWGLLDVGSFPGLPGATTGMWGTITAPTPNIGCKIIQNKFYNFLNILWDGGAIYTTGQQGPSLEEGLLIQGNVAYGKPMRNGGNTIYTDGGSRYIEVESNASYNNPIGITYYGPSPNPSDPLPYPPYYLQNGLPYGSDSGGCRTYGDIDYSGNYWLQAPIPADLIIYNDIYLGLLGFAPWSAMGFCAPCPFTYNTVPYPTNLTYENNTSISSMADIPASLLLNAGVQSKPPTIPANRWILPP